ncbi:hypothetical protein V5O48_007557 [Marasmius crinis-equi]|uniref:Uncharacterized protein n=1 Tax=Marasmius crinis-equi TaxID=585013 RepID=A0ABR3FGJ8_9AGAR
MSNEEAWIENGDSHLPDWAFFIFGTLETLGEEATYSAEFRVLDSGLQGDQRRNMVELGR